jgi:aspartyl aminopeptidase
MRYPTCSPCLKLKPQSKGMKAGFLTVNVEPYGGGLWHTWFDRDLSVAGRVLVRQGDRLVHKLASLPSSLPVKSALCPALKPSVPCHTCAIEFSRDETNGWSKLNWSKITRAFCASTWFSYVHVSQGM